MADDSYRAARKTMGDSIRIEASTFKYHGGIGGRGAGWVAESYEAGGVKTTTHKTKGEALRELRELVVQKLKDADETWELLWCGDGETVLLVRPRWYSILKKTGEMGSCGTGDDLRGTRERAIRHAEQSYGGIEYPEKHRTTDNREAPDGTDQPGL